MKLKLYVSSLLICSLLSTLSGCKKDTNISRTPLGKEYELSQTTLKDKIKGGWAGQVIGCTYGGPTEFKYLDTMIHDYIPIVWNDSAISHYYKTFPGLYDDIYMDLTFVDVIDKYGIEAPVDSFANAFAHAGYMLWAANQMGRYNILQGMKAPMSGHWLNNPHADDIDFQIEADFIGLMYPGMPQSAAKLADKVGHIMNYGDGYYGGLYVATLYSLAFVMDDVTSVVKEALKAIPKESTYYQCMNDIIQWHHTYPDDWKQTWFECQKKWDFDIGAPNGVFAPYNIDAKINSAYVLIGLLYGQGDFLRSMDIATRCGQDTDCNAATVAGIIGVLKGYENIPSLYTRALTPVLDENFAYSDISLNKIYDLSYQHAERSILSEGGKVENDIYYINTQTIKVVPYEKSFEDHFPYEIIGINKNMTDSIFIDFKGKGIVVTGGVKSDIPSYSAIIEAYCDGILIDTLILPSDFTHRKTEIFFKYQLSNQKHTISLKWKNPLKNTQVYVGQTVVYSDTFHKAVY